MEGVQPLNENVGNGPRSRFKWRLVASGIQGLWFLLCVVFICLHFYSPPVKYPPIQSIRVQLTGCEKERLVLITLPNIDKIMKVQNNSIIIACDGFYLISLKGSFFQEVRISLHSREGRNPISIPMQSPDYRVDFTTVASLGFKDIVYLNVKASNTSCEEIQINDGELILVQLNPGGFCVS